MRESKVIYRFSAVWEISTFKTCVIQESTVVAFFSFLPWTSSCRCSIIFLALVSYLSNGGKAGKFLLHCYCGKLMSHSLGLARIWVYSFSPGGFLTCTLFCLTIYSSSSPGHSVIMIVSLLKYSQCSMAAQDDSIFHTLSLSSPRSPLMCVAYVWFTEDTHTLRLSGLVNTESVCYWMQQCQPSAARLTLCFSGKNHTPTAIPFKENK